MSILATTVELSVIGQLATRDASKISSSQWSVGGETLDRDFTIYQNYREFLGPLGAKAIRFQTGWAKCEPEPGRYEWAWLDEIVDDAIGRGLKPWLSISYGNPAYPDGGSVDLGGPGGGLMPRGVEALAGWDAWVRELIRRYRDRVDEWEIWNEPDVHGSKIASEYVDLHIRTAEIIRTEQPKAKIYAMGLAGKVQFAEEVLEGLKQRGKIDTVDAITIHGYPRNPDSMYSLDKLQKLLDRYDRPIQVRQGETGAPSELQHQHALRGIEWNETTQAKWDLRRMLVHSARAIPFNLFSISDMLYVREGKARMNTKGLVTWGGKEGDSRPKLSYYTAARVFSIFDDSVKPAPDITGKAEGVPELAVRAWRTAEGAPIVALWLGGKEPIESNESIPINLELSHAIGSNLVLADLLSGKVYAWTQGGGQRFQSLPVTDSPILLASRESLPVVEKQEE